MPQPFTVESQDGQTPLATIDTNGNLIVKGAIVAGGVAGSSGAAGTLVSPQPLPAAGTVQGITDVLGGGAMPGLYTEPTGTVAATVGGRDESNSTTGSLASGTVYVNLIGIPAGVTVRNVNLFVTTAEVNGSHAWAGIASTARTVLAVSADNTGATYFAPANTAIATAVTVDGVRPWVCPASGPYYVFVCAVQGTTAPVFAASSPIANAALAAIPPVMVGTSSAGQTTPPAVGATLGAITPTAGFQFYTWLT